MIENSLIIKNNTNYNKNILVVGVVHGDEEQGEKIILNYLENSKKAGKNKLFFIPRLNSEKSRKNKNGVDLNRNFPTKNWELSDPKSDYFGGFEPNSEHEVKFLVRLLEENKFDAIITLHAPFNIVNYDCGNCEDIAKSLAKKIASILNLKVKKDIGYPTPGSFGTYAGVERDIPIITIELDEKKDARSYFGHFLKIFEYLENEF